MAVGGITRFFRTAAQAVIRAGVREGLSGQAILDGIKGEVGRAYRRQDFYTDLRRHQAEYLRSQLLGAIDPNARITRDLITDAAPRGGFNYEYRFHVLGTDRRTGEEIDRYISVGSDELLTLGVATDELYGALGISDHGSDAIQPQEVTLDAVYSEE